MKTVSEISELRAQVKTWRQQGLTIAFVPTMGNLHVGHVSLVDEAHKHADKVIASIFVNPMQFGVNEDIDNYPRTMIDDQQNLTDAATDLLFTPTPDIIYPKGVGENSYVEVPNISDLYCGASRPGHFRGVATVVCKLFNLVQPDVACFGSKDYQQLQVIQTMVEDLSMPVNVVTRSICPALHSAHLSMAAVPATCSEPVRGLDGLCASSVALHYRSNATIFSHDFFYIKSSYSLNTVQNSSGHC